MGTSQLPNGAPSGVSLVPPWVPDIPSPLQPVPDNSDSDGGGESAPETEQEQPQPMIPSGKFQHSPNGRFSGARTHMGWFADTGSKDYMRSGIGHYIKTGYGGAGSAVSRMGNAVSTAGMLYGTLASLSAGQQSTQGAGLSLESFVGLSAEGVINAVTNSLVPSDGTLDAESSRRAVNDSLSELLTEYPDADLLSLNEEQRLFAVERLLVNEVFNRAMLDLEKHIVSKCNIQEAMIRFSDINKYISEVINAEFRSLCEANGPLTTEVVREVATTTLLQTFEVFEGAVE